jgi:hypothetical protein
MAAETIEGLDQRLQELQKRAAGWEARAATAQNGTARDIFAEAARYCRQAAETLATLKTLSSEAEMPKKPPAPSARRRRKLKGVRRS